MIDNLESEQAYIIHQYPIRDHLSLVYVMTPTRYFKGFYRIPKKKSIVQKPFSFFPYWCHWKKNKQAINIQSLEFLATPPMLKGLKLIVGLYLNELIFHLCGAFDEQIELHVYPLYEAILQHQEDCPLHLIREFEWQLLADCGYAIDFTRTVDNLPLQDDVYYQFSPDSGFFVAESGWLGKDILNHHENKTMVKQVLKKTIDYVLDGKILNSRVLLHEWLKSSQNLYSNIKL